MDNYKKLIEKRKEKGYTISDMCKVIDNSEANYCKKEQGQVRFSVTEAMLIADFLDCKVEDLFTRDNFQ